MKNPSPLNGIGIANPSGKMIQFLKPLILDIKKTFLQQWKLEPSLSPPLDLPHPILHYMCIAASTSYPAVMKLCQYLFIWHPCYMQATPHMCNNIFWSGLNCIIYYDIQVIDIIFKSVTEFTKMSHEMASFYLCILWPFRASRSTLS